MKVAVPLSNAHRLLSGALVIVTAQHLDRINAMTASWSIPVSMDPAMAAVALHARHLTTEIIQSSGEFVLNVPSRRQTAAAVILGSVSGRDVSDKIAAAGLSLADPGELNTPHIDECLAWIECAVSEVRPVGDHYLFIGTIAGAWAEDDAFGDTWLLPNEEDKPLYHLGGNWFAVPEERIQAQIGAEV